MAGAVAFAGCSGSGATETLQPQTFVVVDMSLSPSPVPEGAELTVEMTVRNVGDVRGEGTLPVYLDGEVVRELSIPLLYPDQGKLERVSFRPFGVGEHELRVGGKTTTFEVTASEPSSALARTADGR